MKLNVKERLLLLQIFQQMRGDITTLRILNDLTSKVGFSDEESMRLNMRNDGRSIQWDTGQTLEVDVEFGEKASDLVREKLREMSQAKSLTLEFLPLWEKFMPDGD